MLRFIASLSATPPTPYASQPFILEGKSSHMQKEMGVPVRCVRTKKRRRLTKALNYATAGEQGG